MDAYNNYFANRYLRVAAAGQEIFTVKTVDSSLRPRFAVLDGVWGRVIAGAIDPVLYVVPATGALTALQDLVGGYSTNIFTNNGAQYAASFTVADNAAGNAWRPAAVGNIVGGAAGQALANVQADGNNYWFCIYDRPGTNTRITADYTVGLARQQFGTVRRAAAINIATDLEILDNWSSSEAIGELRFAMSALFEFGNDQLVYRNGELPEERTNLIPTAKAPGIF